MYKPQCIALVCYIALNFEQVQFNSTIFEWRVKKEDISFEYAKVECVRLKELTLYKHDITLLCFINKVNMVYNFKIYIYNFVGREAMP